MLLLLPTVVIASCDDEKIGDIVKQQALYFEVNHINFAWGYNHGGYLIDSLGRVLTYKVEEKPATDIRETDTFTKARIEEKLSNSTVSAFALPARELSEKAAQIYKITGNKFSKTVQIGADQGVTSFYAYRYDPREKTYTRVLLSRRGDIAFYNTDSDARELTKWIESVLQRYSEATNKD
ncbi:hypothetical protein GCM10023091_36120 [Ravibacter arvi]|uniref:PsbP C-terminal domain-containing protein n=2 Tax=Ravibacter arvi TaxID=2051041 RepID=A0ABP8M5V5_9BACT